MPTPWHQNKASYTRQMTHETIIFWVPLEPVTKQSGCLRFIPGSNYGPILTHRPLNDDPRKPHQVLMVSTIVSAFSHDPLLTPEFSHLIGRTITGWSLPATAWSLVAATLATHYPALARRKPDMSSTPLAPATERPALSVLVCTRNRASKLKRAVDSILANSFRDFELIVVDQSTDRATEEGLSEIDDPRLRYIPTPTVGVAISRNIAIRASQADTVVFTDDDCVCDKEWLAGIVAEYAADPAAMGIYGRVIPFGPQQPGMICPCINESTERLVFVGPAIPHLALGGGNNMSFKKAVFRKVGLFRESLGPGTRIGHAEDTEFSYRVLWNRCRIVYAPTPTVQHDKWLNRAEFSELMRGAVRGLAIVFTSFALRFDGLAFTQLLRTGYYISRNRMSIGSVSRGLASFASGVALGPLYRLVRPLRYQASSSGTA